VPAGEVYSTALAMAGRYAGGPAIAIRAAKKAIDEGLEMDLDAGLRLESTLFAGLFATDDRAIGMTSFVENGPGKAVFTGR
jgi:enoyl-CoA hydratase/carnithine racemase